MSCLKSLFNFHENFDGIIQQKYITEELSAAKASKERLINAVFDSLDSVQSLAKEFPLGGQISLVLDDRKENLCIEGPDSLLDEAFIDYLTCTNAVKSQIQSILNTLGKEFKRKRSFLIATCQFCLTLQALVHHSWSSQGKDWKLPNISRALTPI